MSLVVFAVGVLALAAVIPMGFKRNNTAAQQSRASELAASCAERLLQSPFAEPDLASGSHDDGENPRVGNYYLQWEVEDDQPITSCKRITIKVRINSITAPVVESMVVVASEAGS